MQATQPCNYCSSQNFEAKNNPFYFGARRAAHEIIKTTDEYKPYFESTCACPRLEDGDFYTQGYSTLGEFVGQTATLISLPIFVPVTYGVKAIVYGVGIYNWYKNPTDAQKATEDVKENIFKTEKGSS